VGTSIILPSGIINPIYVNEHAPAQSQFVSHKPEQVFDEAIDLGDLSARP
jgi:hypothetical protein